MGLINPERAKQLADKARNGGNKIPMGVHRMEIVKVEDRVTNKKAPAIVLTFQDVAKAYDAVDEWVVFGNEIHEEKLAKHFLNIGGKDITAVETIAEMVLLCRRTIANKPCMVAIQHSERVWEKDDTNWIKINEPKVWYTGEDGKELKMDMAKALIPLKGAALDRYDAFQKGGISAVAQPNAAAVASNGDPMPWPSVAAEEAAAAVTQPATAQPTTQVANASPAAEKPVAVAEQPKAASAPAAAEEDPLDFLNT